MENHRRNCTGGAPAAKRQRVPVTVPVAVPVAVPGFVLRETCRSLGGVVKQFTVDMMAVSNLSPLKTAMTVFKPSIIILTSSSLKLISAVDPAVVTQPPVTLTSEMLAVYSDSPPPLDDVYRQLLNFIEVYEHNGSGCTT